MIKAEYIHHCGGDITVANSARVSFDNESELEYDAWGPPKLKEKDAKADPLPCKGETHQPIRTLLCYLRVKAPIL